MIKERKFKSVLGKQDELVEDTTETAGKQYINIGNGHFVRRNRTTSSIIPYRFNLPLDSTHTYFGIVLFDKPVSNLNMYNYNATSKTNSPFAKYSLTNGICGTITGIEILDSIHIWQGNDNMPTDIMPVYALYIDLTEYGLDTLTAQQFYDRYNSIFPDVAGNKLSTVKKIYTKYNTSSNLTSSPNAGYVPTVGEYPSENPSFPNACYQVIPMHRGGTIRFAQSNANVYALRARIGQGTTSLVSLNTSQLDNTYCTANRGLAEDQSLDGIEIYFKQDCDLIILDQGNLDTHLFNNGNTITYTINNSIPVEVKKIYTKVNDVITLTYSPLPAEYQRVEYINSTRHGNYIPTGIVPTSNDIRIEIEAALKDTSNDSGLCGIGGSDSMFIILEQPDNSSEVLWRKNRYDWTTVDLSVRHKYIFDGLDVWLNNNKITHDTGDGFRNNTREIELFTTGTTHPTYGYTGYIYSFKVWVQNKLISYMIPCYRKSDNAAGMYDVIRKVFLMNGATLDYLEPGPDVN